MAPVSSSTIPDATIHASSAGGPVFARDPDALVAGVATPPAATVPVAADDVTGATVVFVAPELPLELGFPGVVVVPELGVIRKGAENTLGAVKSF